MKEWRLSLSPPTLEHAARLLGVTAVQMYRYEHGLRRVPPEKVARYSLITGITKRVLRPDVFGPLKRGSTEALHAVE